MLAQALSEHTAENRRVAGRKGEALHVENGLYKVE